MSLWTRAIATQGLHTTLAETVLLCRLIELSLCWKYSDFMFGNCRVMRAFDEEFCLMRYLRGEPREPFNAKAFFWWRTLLRLLAAAAYATNNHMEFYSSPVRLLCLVVLELSDFRTSVCHFSLTTQLHPWTLSYSFKSLVFDPSLQGVCGICLDSLCVPVQTVFASRMQMVPRAPSLSICRLGNVTAQAGMSAARSPAGIAGHVATLPCGHSFHAQCVREAARYRLQCPYCRRSLESKQQITDFDKLFWQLSSIMFFLCCSFWPGAFLHVSTMMVNMLQILIVIGTFVDALALLAKIETLTEIWVG